jgi:hypothetical protein
VNSVLLDAAPPSAPPPPHPLAEAVAPLAGVVPLPLDAPDLSAGAGWCSLSDLLADGGGELDRRLAAVGAAYGTGSRTVIARFFVDGYAWSVVGIGVAGYAGGRRVPDLAADNLALRFGDHGGLEAVALRRGGFACLPGDPAAAHPDAAVVPDVDALRRSLREGMVAHLAPLVAALRARSSLGERSLWLGVADHCVRLFLAATAHLDPNGCLAAREREAAALIQAPDSPLRGPTGVLFVEHDGRTIPWIGRAACCLGYHIPEHGRCDHCPAYRVPERIARIRASLAASD